jgi:hypothetical protein
MIKKNTKLVIFFLERFVAWNLAGLGLFLCYECLANIILL